MQSPRRLPVRQEAPTSKAAALSSSCQQDLRDTGRERAPGLRFRHELVPPTLGQAIELRPPPEFRYRPIGDHPAPTLQPIERRVERALLDDDGVVARAFDRPRDAVTVTRPAGQGLQNQRI